MKYWKLKDNSAVESHNDNVDISTIANEITKEEFDSFISNITKNIPTQKDFKYLYKNAVTDSDKLDIIAQFLKLK